MRNEITTYLEHFDPKEPLLRKWALDLMDILAGGPDPHAARDLADRLVSPAFIEAVLSADNTAQIEQAFRNLPPECFRPALEALENLWQSSRGERPIGLARILSELDPERALRLLDGAMDGADKADLLPQVVTLLEKLPPGATTPLAHRLLAAHDPADKLAPGNARVHHLLFELAWHCDHPQAVDYLSRLLAALRNKRKGGSRWDLVRLAYEMGRATAEYHLACDRIEKTNTHALTLLAPFYEAGTDLEGFDQEMCNIGRRRYAGIPEMVARHAPAIGDRRLARTLTQLVADEAFIESLHKKKQRPYLYGLVLSLLLRSRRRATPEFKDLTLAAAMGLLSADMVLLPNKNDLVAWIAGADRGQVLAHLQPLLTNPAEPFPHRRVVELAGRLKEPSLLEAVLSIPVWSTEDESYAVSVQQALIHADEAVFDLAEGQWDQLDEMQRLLTLQIAAGALSQSAARYIESHFDAFWHLDRDCLLEICPLLGLDCRPRIEHLVNKNQPLVDEVWLTLSLLNGDRSDTVIALLKAHQAAEEEMVAKCEAAMRPEAPLNAMPGHIDADLTCSDCGETFNYRLKRIWLNPEEKGDYYPVEELQCLGCNRLADFSFSGEGIYAISMHALDLHLAASQSEFQTLLEKSPFEILPRVVSYGAERRIGEAVDACREEIFQQPEAPLPFFELGNIYVNIDHRVKARQCFENVIALAPDAIEAYLMLAQMAMDKEDFEDAREQLERGMAHLEQPRLLMVDDVSRDPLVSFYRTLAERLADPEPNLSDLFSVAEPPQLRKEKIGRNDPCPCGSGKKYKHCCLGRGR
jgi:thioredoxin-like negative regulator of GroEL